MKLPHYPVFLLLFLSFAFILGIGYYWVSKNPNQNHAIVIMGVVTKILVFVGLSADVIAGNISIYLLGSGIVDLIFAILFVEFLLTAGRHGNIKFY